MEVTEVDENNGDFTADLEDVEDKETAECDIQEEIRKRAFVVMGRALQNDPLWDTCQLDKMAKSRYNRGVKRYYFYGTRIV